MSALSMADTPVRFTVGELARNWWVLVLRGILAVILGIFALVWPGATLWVLVIIFGAFVLAEGLALLISLRHLPAAARGGAAVQGIADILIGIVALFWPGAAVVGIAILLVVWMLVAGVTQLSNAFNMPPGMDGRGVMGFTGVVFLFFALIVIFHPLSGVVALAWLFGILALLAGISMLFLGFRLKGLETR
ncbi:MAG TPA: DUF308 domain-containing protein [bacterium]|nr:DUF308 domain-containing protein [bacterium]HPQ66084.1 DUF308 domain-containing protein [bacterium]